MALLYAVSSMLKSTGGVIRCGSWELQAWGHISPRRPTGTNIWVKNIPALVSFLGLGRFLPCLTLSKLSSASAQAMSSCVHQPETQLFQPILKESSPAPVEHLSKGALQLGQSQNQSCKPRTGLFPRRCWNTHGVGLLRKRFQYVFQLQPRTVPES